MKTRVAALAVVVIAAALALVAPAQSQGTGIRVEGADAIREMGIAPAPGLNTLLANVGPRFAVEHANGLRYQAMTPIAPELQVLLGQVGGRFILQHANVNQVLGMSPAPDPLLSLIATVADRFVLQHANANRRLPLTPIASELATLLGQASSRIVLQHANANQAVGLRYPSVLISDTNAPLISGVTARVGASEATITWTTDELATSAILYGTQPDSLTQTVSDAQFVKQHVVTVTGLTPGVAYYYAIRSTDRSGNTITTPATRLTDGSVPTQSFIFLPLLQRNGR